MMKASRITSYILVLVFAIATTLVSYAGKPPPPIGDADLVMKNGFIYTVDSSHATVSSIAIKGNKIIYVGDDAGVTEFIGADTRIINLTDGKMVMPAFVDSHMHPADSAYLVRFQIDLTNVWSVDGYLSAIEEYANAHPELYWLIGAGYQRSYWDEIGPRKEDLDAIDSTRPIAVWSADGHSMWCNSKAFEEAGITAATPDPENGIIMRDPVTGEPSGLLLESAINLVADLFPEPDKTDVKQALLWLNGWLNERGFTTAFDAWLQLDKPWYYEAYDELAQAGLLTVRYRGAWYIDPIGNWNKDIGTALRKAEKYNHRHFKAHAFKFFADEVLEERTGYLLEPYDGDPDWYGIKDWDDADMLSAFKRIDRAGYQLHIHQIGDAAARYTLDALEAMVASNGTRDSRHSLAHVQMATPEDVVRMGQLGLSAHMSPYWHDIDDYFWDLYLPYLGWDRAYNQMYPHKSLFDAGVNVTCASDWWVTEPDQMWAFFGGMYRLIPQRIFHDWYYGYPEYRYVTDPYAELTYGDIGVLGPLEERVALEEMIESATINGAYAHFLDGEVGSLEVGKLADIVVVDRNLFTVARPDQLANAKVLMTIFEGKIVYEAPNM